MLRSCFSRFRPDTEHVGAECGEVGIVRFAPGANGDVDRRVAGACSKAGQELDARQLTEAALEAIAIDGGMLVSWHDDANA